MGVVPFLHEGLGSFRPPNLSFSSPHSSWSWLSSPHWSKAKWLSGHINSRLCKREDKVTAAERDASVMQAMWRHFTMISVSTDARPRLKAHRHICLQFTDDQRRLEPWTRGGGIQCLFLIIVNFRTSKFDRWGWREPQWCQIQSSWLCQMFGDSGTGSESSHSQRSRLLVTWRAFQTFLQRLNREKKVFVAKSEPNCLSIRLSN